MFCAQGIEAPLKTVGERVGISASAISQRLARNTISSNGLSSPPPSVQRHRWSSARVIDSIRALPSWVSFSRALSSTTSCLRLSSDNTSRCRRLITPLNYRPSRPGRIPQSGHHPAASKCRGPNRNHPTSERVPSHAGRRASAQTCNHLNEDQLIQFAQQLARDLTPLLIEPRAQHGVTQ